MGITREFYENIKKRLGFISIFVVTIPTIFIMCCSIFLGYFRGSLEIVGASATIMLSLISWWMYNKLKEKYKVGTELIYYIAILPFLLGLILTLMLFFEKKMFDLLQIYMGTIPTIIFTTIIGFYTIEQAYYNKLMSDFVSIEQEPQIIFYEDKPGFWTIYNSGKIGVLLVEVILLLETKKYLRLSEIDCKFQKENKEEAKSLPFIIKPNETFWINIHNTPPRQNEKEIKEKTRTIIFFGLTKNNIPCIFIFERARRNFRLLDKWYNIDDKTVKEIAEKVDIPEEKLLLFLTESNLL